jgi:aminomethyltransferase
MSGLRRTPLFDRHVALKAKLADFGGWDMPIEYVGVVAEHTAVREAAGVFDVSHMGKVLVLGPGAAAYANTVLTNDLERIEPGRAQYSMLCNADGGVIDDLIVYRVSDDEVFIVPNASNASLVVRALRESAPASLDVVDLHDELAIVAIQGPRSPEVLAALGLSSDHDYMSFVDEEWMGANVRVCRTGYTGERGYEVIAPSATMRALWDEVLSVGRDLGVMPAGLGARDTLRTEMGYPLHGQDLSPTISPVQARLGWAVGWDKSEFHGRAALLAEREAASGPRLWGIRALERAIPRAHMSVQSLDGQIVGETTSGTFSPTLREGIGLALLDGAGLGDEVVVDVRGRPARFAVVRPPFVPSST